jgi:hypothetical protein
MAILSSDMPASEETVAGDLTGTLNFLIDPKEAATRLPYKWFWIAPLILVSMISIAVHFMLMPALQHVLAVQPLAPNLTPQQAQTQSDMILLIQRIATWFTPVIAAVMMLISAVILWGTASMLAIEAKFRAVFNLIAGCSTISALAALAMAIIVDAKGDPSTMAELQPPLGLDIFLADGANKFLLAFLGYFSLFEIWWIVMAVLIFSAGFRVTKARALAAIAPLVLLGLIFKLAGAMFQR